MSAVIEYILKQCDGVKVVRVEHEQSYCANTFTDTFIKTGDIVLPANDIVVEILMTATKGTIGRVVGLEKLETYAERYPDSNNSDPNKIATYDATLIYEVDGRKQKGRIKDHYTKVRGDNPETKYVRDVKKHKKVIIKN